MGGGHSKRAHATTEGKGREEPLPELQNGGVKDKGSPGAKRLKT